MIERRRREPRRVARPGEPNVLSNAAKPNTLSSMGGRPARADAGSRAEADPRIDTGPALRPRSGTPSLGTILLLVFLLITAIRVIGELLR